MDYPNQGQPPYQYQSAPPPRKSNLWKWVLGCGCLAVVLVVVGIVGAAGLGVWFVGKSFTADPAKAKSIAEGIVQFDVPKGYEMKFGMNLAGMKIAFFGKPNEKDKGIACIMMQVPKSFGMSQKQIEANLNKQAQEKAGRDEMTLEVSGESTVRIGDKDVKVVRNTMISKENKEKVVLVQLFLEKPDSNVLIQVFGPEGGFDEEACDSFIRSLK